MSTHSQKIGLVILVAAIGIFAVATALASLSGNQDDNPGEQDQDKKLETSAEYLRSLREKEEELNEREQNILQREQQLIVQEKDLSDRITAFEKDKNEFEELKQTWREEQEAIQQAAESERIRTLAASFKSIKSATAANQLIALFNQNKTTALLIMNLIDNRTLGKLFSKITDPDKAAEIYEAYKNWNISVEDARDIVENTQN